MSDHVLPLPYLRAEPSPESFVRLLRQEFRGRMLGVGLLTGGLVGLPFLVACGSCPAPHAVHYAHELTPEIRARVHSDMSEEEACEAMCGGPVTSCHRATIVPGAPSSESRRLYSHTISGATTQLDGPWPPPREELLVCEVMERMFCGGVGRPPEGLVQRARLRELASARDPLIAYAEGAAHLEAASAISFIQLATELEAHGAPAHLIAAAERSAVDEVRHARAASVLAHSLGGRPVDPVVAIPAPRPLAQVLRENASVGGVEETYGAWVLTRQLEKATDERVRRFVSAIAVDERRHARLANDINRWGSPLLPSAERASNAEDVSLAWSELSVSLGDEPDPALAGAAGLPSATESCAWIERHNTFAPSMWRVEIDGGALWHDA